MGRREEGKRWREGQEEGERGRGGPTNTVIQNSRWLVASATCVAIQTS